MSTGIVCEFNPFHNGHKYLIDSVKRQTGDTVICAMSGNFVQRGEYAFADKYIRAKWAVENRADIVLENSFPFSCATAEKFAQSGVFVLAKAGCDSIAFGVENEEVLPDSFFELAKILLDEKTQKEIGKIVKQNKNIGYAVARSGYILEKYGRKLAELLDTPNSLLGVEYAKAIIKFGFDMRIITFERQGSAHDGKPFGNFASGSYLRENFSAEVFRKYCPQTVDGKTYVARMIDKEKLYAALCARLFAAEAESISEIAEVPQEYALKMKRSAECCGTYDEFFESLKAKHMTDAKLRRMVIYTLANVKKEELENISAAANLLSFSEDGARILRRMKKENTDFTVLSKISDMKKLSEKDRAVFEKQLSVEKLFERME